MPSALGGMNRLLVQQTGLWHNFIANALFSGGRFL
jgi:hypothetical protein